MHQLEHWAVPVSKMRKDGKKGPADPRVHGRQVGSILDSVGISPTKRLLDVIKRVRLKNGRELIIRKAEPNDALDCIGADRKLP